MPAAEGQAASAGRCPWWSFVLSARFTEHCCLVGPGSALGAESKGALSPPEDTQSRSGRHQRAQDCHGQCCQEPWGPGRDPNPDWGGLVSAS